METPFVYGTIATGLDFTDREEETKHLINNFKALTNTVIISPRRWGKSSLVYKASQSVSRLDSDIKICHVDLFNVRDEMHFYELFAEKVISSTSDKWDEVISTAKKLMGSIIPRMSLSDGIGSGMSFDFNFNRKDFNPDQILDLPEKIAKEKKIKVIVCIDEFQNIGELKDGDYIFRRLRSHWQLHCNASYCLYGSKRHMMLEIFSDSSKPFYKFGDLIFLSKISREYWVPFLTKRFKETGKQLDNENAFHIAALVADHPYYCQQLAQIAWLRTEKVCTREIIEKSHKALIEQLSLLFENITEGLTDQQLSYLHALLNDEENFSSNMVMERYGISSSTAAVRSRTSLMEKDIIDRIGKTTNFQDPMYRYWLKTIYFGESFD